LEGIPRVVGKRIFIAVAVFTVSFIVPVLTGTADTRSCFVEIGGHRIRVDVADTPEKMVLGLSSRKKLREDEGMLFVYSDKERRIFWMKDMFFDLDIVWIAGDKIAGITRNAKAEGSQPSRIYDSEVPVNLVLEINAGLSDRWGVREGQRISVSERCLLRGADAHRQRRVVSPP
jgi:uncharacterized membrane protein (UPF0127 family)